jgi:hypothetical protein
MAKTHTTIDQLAKMINEGFKTTATVVIEIQDRDLD